MRLMESNTARTRAPQLSRGGRSPCSRIAVRIWTVLATTALIIFITRQRRAHTNELVVNATNDGTTIIESDVASDILDEALSGKPSFISWNVTACTVRRASVPNVTVVCRRGASPRAVSPIIDNYLTDLNTLSGTEIPAAVRIGGGLRTRSTARQCVQAPSFTGTAPRGPQSATPFETP